MPEDIFLPNHYEATRKPLHEASPLPGWCYTSKEWYEREMDVMFRKQWLCVGRVDQVPTVGEYYVIDVVGHPLIVVRDTQDNVSVLSALCRHRGAIVAEGSGKCRAFVCPYHSWTYALNGELTGVPGTPPPMAGVKGFDKAKFGLNEIRAEVWQGFIFINFDDSAESLMEWLGELPDLVADYDLANMQWTHRDPYEVDCNWKLWLENAFENYHVPTVHKDHYDPKSPQYWQFENTAGRGSWEAMFSKRSIVAYSGLPVIPGLPGDKEPVLYHIWVQPSLQIILTSSYMKFRQYLPMGPDKVKLYENWTFPKTTVQSDEFSKTVNSEYYEKYSQVILEDLGINPIVHRAMRSGAYTPGRYSLEEYIVHRIANRVLDSVIGPAA